MDWLADNGLNEFGGIVGALRHGMEELVPAAQWLFARQHRS